MYALMMRKSERASEREGGESEGMCVYERDYERVGGDWGGREGGWEGEGEERPNSPSRDALEEVRGSFEEQALDLHACNTISASVYVHACKTS